MADLRKAFLHDIIENIEDDAPRLVFADWLEDNGDPERAEFIRLQCKIAVEQQWPRYAGRHVASKEADPRIGVLVAGSRGEWKAEAPMWAANASFRRGFVASVQATAREFLRGISGLYKRVPVEMAILSNLSDDHLLQLADRPEAEHIRCLEFGVNSNSDIGLWKLFRFGQLRRLAWLNVTLGGQGYAINQLNAFIDAIQPGCLRYLGIHGGSLGPEGAARLAGWRMLDQMVTLDLSLAHLTGAGVSELAASSNFASLEHLELQSNAIDDTGLIALAQSPHLGRLTYLGVGNNPAITDKGIQALAASPYLTRLTCLNLAYLAFSEATAVALAESETLLNVRQINGFLKRTKPILARLAERRHERGLE